MNKSLNKYAEKDVCVYIFAAWFQESAPTLETTEIRTVHGVYNTDRALFICTKHSQNRSGILYIIRNITSPKWNGIIGASDMDFPKRSESKGLTPRNTASPLHHAKLFHIQSLYIIHYRTWNIQCIVYSQNILTYNHYNTTS